MGVIAEPRGLDHAAALRRGSLLVLAGKIVFAQGAAELCQDLSWLALGVQDLTRFAAKDLAPEHGLDPVQFVRLGDCRQAHDVPILLCHHGAVEIVPRVTPEGRLSCSRCMISTIAPRRDREGRITAPQRMPLQRVKPTRLTPSRLSGAQRFVARAQ